MNRFVKLIFLAMAAGVFSSTAQALNYTNTASGNWKDTPLSWSGSQGASALDSVIVFNPSALDNSTNDNTGAFLLNQMWLATNQTVTLSSSGGSSLLFTNNAATMPVITNAGASTFTLNTPITVGTNLTIGVGNASGNITINSNITSVAGSTNGLTKTGAGTLTLTGTNTYTGVTAVSNGTLTVNGGQITNTAGSSVAASASLVITNGGQVIHTSANTFKISGAANVTGSNSLWTGGSAYLYVEGVLTVANTGKVNNVSRVYMDATGGSVIVTNGGNMNSSANVLDGYGSGANSNSLYVGGNGATWNLGGGGLFIGYSASTNNHVVVDNGGALNPLWMISVGYVSGAFGNYMVITNGGQVFSSGASSIGNGAGANSNYVWIGSTATGAGSTSLWSLGGYSLTIGASGATGNWMTVSSGGILTNGSVALGGVGSVLTLGGDAYLSGVNVTAPDAQLKFSGGALHATANGTLISGAVWTNTSSPASLDSAAYTVTNAIVVAGTGSLTKLGSGTMVLTSNNTYSGVTTVNNGVLKLASSGTISNSPTITVSNGATFDVSAYTSGYTLTNQVLAGKGVVTGSVVVAAGGGVSGGDTSGSGQLSFSNNLTLNPGAVVYSYYNATTNAHINVAGTLSLPTVATVQVTQVSGSLPSSYVLFTFGTGAGEASSDRSLSGWVITGGRSYSQAIVNNGQVKLVSPTGMIVEIY